MSTNSNPPGSAPPPYGYQNYTTFPIAGPSKTPSGFLDQNQWTNPSYQHHNDSLGHDVSLNDAGDYGGDAEDNDQDQDQDVSQAIVLALPRSAIKGVFLNAGDYYIQEELNLAASKSLVLGCNDHDMPKTNGQWQDLVFRIMSAVKDTSNLVELSGLGPNQKEGNQVKRIRGTYYDHVLERTAWDILIKVIKAYKGEILVPTYLKCKKEYFTTFTQRFEDVIDVLKISCAADKSIFDPPFQERLCEAPNYEYNTKIGNLTINTVRNAQNRAGKLVLAGGPLSAVNMTVPKPTFQKKNVSTQKIIGQSSTPKARQSKKRDLESDDDEGMPNMFMFCGSQRASKHARAGAGIADPAFQPMIPNLHGQHQDSAFSQTCSTSLSSLRLTELEKLVADDFTAPGRVAELEKRYKAIILELMSVGVEPMERSFKDVSLAELRFYFRVHDPSTNGTSWASCPGWTFDGLPAGSYCRQNYVFDRQGASQPLVNVLKNLVGFALEREDIFIRNEIGDLGFANGKAIPFQRTPDQLKALGLVVNHFGYSGIKHHEFTAPPENQK